jgi:hypothetical protein
MTLPWSAVVVAAFWRVTVAMLKPVARLRRRASASISLNLVINIKINANSKENHEFIG